MYLRQFFFIYDPSFKLTDSFSHKTTTTILSTLKLTVTKSPDDLRPPII